MRPDRYGSLCWSTVGKYSGCFPKCIDLLSLADLGDVLRRLRHEARCGAATDIRLSWMGRLYTVRPKHVQRLAQILPKMVKKAR